MNSSSKSLFSFDKLCSNSSLYLPKDLTTPVSYKTLLQIIKLISNDHKHPLHSTLTDHYLLFHYILNHTETLIDLNNDDHSFHLNPKKKYNEIRISRINPNKLPSIPINPSQSPSISSPVNPRQSPSIHQPSSIPINQNIEYEENCLTIFEFTNETDRKRSTELNMLNEHKNKILVHVAHEFRTPLNSIIGNLELVQDLEEIPLEIKEDHLKPALFSSTLLLNYINDILDFSQLRAEKLKMNYIKFNLLNHITTVSKIMEILAKKKGVNFEKLIDNDIPPIITSDPNRLTQILLNLLSNAFKFTLPTGRVLLRITYDSEEKTIRFEISDNGIGISEGNMKKLFQEFGKVNSDQNSLLNPSGVGLGLIISRKFAEEMGPSNKKGFEVKSEIGKGTAFTFYLQDKGNISKDHDIMQKSCKLSFSSNMLNDSKELEALNVKNRNLEDLQKKKWLVRLIMSDSSKLLDVTPRTMDRVILGSYTAPISLPTHVQLDLKCFPFSPCQCPRILVVDDDMFNVCYLQNILKILGYSTDFAVNGEDAINKLKRRLEKKCCERCKVFKLVFMDSEMPNLNGLQATAIIKAMPFDNEIVIIGCTGNSALNDVDNFKKVGADMVCFKPVGKRKIMDILEAYKILFD